MWTIYYKQRNKSIHDIYLSKKEDDSRYIYQNVLDKAWFQYDVVFGDFRDSTRRTVSDKILRDKAFNSVKNLKYHRYQRGFTSMSYNLFDNKN